MTECHICGKQQAWFTIGDDNLCETCYAAASKDSKTDTFPAEPIDFEDLDPEYDDLAKVIVTTETSHNLPVQKRLDIITAEVVIGLHLFKDIASAFRDTFGGRSKAMEDALREARITALTELRREALELGADAIVGVDLDYSEVSGGGKSMLFLVASGTAVTLFDPASGSV